jgi:hypothetical protein
MPTISSRPATCSRRNDSDFRFKPDPVKGLAASQRSAALVLGTSLNPVLAHTAGLRGWWDSQFEPGPCHPANFRPGP